MWNKLKNLFAVKAADESLETASIQKLVNINSLNKRKNARIKYPHFGAIGPFPKIFYMNTELIVGNISVGGLLVIDDTEKLGNSVGEVIHIEMAWVDLVTKVRARVVGANMQRRHLQFVDFHPQAFIRISQLIKPGYLGHRFHRVNNDTGIMQALEMWLGPSNENLVFKENGIELSMGTEVILFGRGQPARFKKNNELIPPSLLSDCLIMLANFPESTERIKELIEMVETEIKVISPPPRRTGSYG